MNPTPPPIRVQVEARSPVVRAGLAAFLESSPGFAVTAEGADVLVTDADPAPGLPPAVVLGEETTIGESVRGLLPRDATETEVLASLQAVAAGLIAIHPRFLDTLGARPVQALEEPLTPRELEVLGLLAEGVANKEIAYRLGISEHTVKFHVASLLDKLHASSRTEAVSIGIRAGLVML